MAYSNGAKTNAIMMKAKTINNIVSPFITIY